MAPSKVEEAAQTNEPPNSQSGILTPSPADTHWTPETVLSTLPERPAENTTSPLPFFHMLERLKTTRREGWRRFSINHGESIADHMYRMSIITLFCPPTLASKLDVNRCTQMALVHDMAESLVGDITPVDGVSKSEKSRRESETMDYLCKNLLGSIHPGSGQAETLQALWQEYEDDSTAEAHFVHDVDKIELLLQMIEYEKSHKGRIDLGEFAWVATRIMTAEVKAWAQEVLDEREKFWAETGKVPSGVTDVSEERKRQQDEYYGGNGNGDVDGSAKAPKLDPEVNGTAAAKES